MLIGTKIYDLSVVDSVMDEALSLYRKSGKLGLVVTSEEQRKGRGRNGRVWVSKKSQNLLFATVLDVDQTVISHLPIMAALALFDCVSNFVDIEASFKWPNDVLLDGFKVAGILIDNYTNNETTLSVLGIGINVNMTKDDAKKLNATSLRIVSGKKTDKAFVKKELLVCLNRRYKTLLEGTLNIGEWEKRLTNLGKEVTVYRKNEPSINGVAEGIDPSGGLLVRTSQGVVSVLADDVSISAPLS